MKIRLLKSSPPFGASLDEAQIRQLQKMEVVGQLTSGLAHDFRHILSVIIANLELLMMRYTADASDQTALQRAMDAATRGVAAIQSMMHFVRKKPLDPQVVDLNDVIEMTMLHQALGSRISLEWASAAYPNLVRVDRTQLELAILNIALNARDAMPDGGILTILTETVTLDGEHGLIGDYASVVIRDTGIGIAADDLANVLEPFFTTKDEEEGTGLGLSMVDGFVKQYQGAVAIDSVVGEGTAVTIFLPTACNSCEFQPTCESPPCRLECVDAGRDDLVLSSA
jgi:signal transduction histidine kinase